MTTTITDEDHKVAVCDMREYYSYIIIIAGHYSADVHFIVCSFFKLITESKS
jgi:hypothetical protein